FMVGHICRFNPRYAAAKAAVAEGRVGQVVSLYARRNIPARVTTEILNQIGPIAGDGVHDTDLMLWYTGAKVVSAYAQAVDLRVPAAALGDPEEGGVLEPLEQLQAHHLRVEPLHGVEVVDPQGDSTWNRAG